MKHDPATCPVCGPIVATAAYKRGTAAAAATTGTAALTQPAPTTPTKEHDHA